MSESCKHRQAIVQSKPGGWHRMLCQQCGLQGRWGRNESSAWGQITAAQKLASGSSEPRITADEIAALRKLAEAACNWKDVDDHYGAILAVESLEAAVDAYRAAAGSAQA